MQSTTLISSFAEIAREKDIDRDSLTLIVEDVFRAMIRKRYGADDNFDIIFNPDNGGYPDPPRPGYCGELEPEGSGHGNRTG